MAIPVKPLAHSRSILLSFHETRAWQAAPEPSLFGGLSQRFELGWDGGGAIPFSPHPRQHSQGHVSVPNEKALIYKLPLGVDSLNLITSLVG